MAEGKKKVGGAGLRGQSAGETKLCTVGKTGSGLTYNGYDVADLAENASFYETAYLIFHGELPNQTQLDELNRFRVAGTFTFGYNVFNFSFYYSLNPLFDGTLEDENTPVNLVPLKIGLMFYIL